MKNNTAFLTVSLAVLALGACTSAPVTTLPPGQYEHRTTSTNAAGTEVDKTTQTDVYYDQNGNKRATQQTRTTTDPKGLFNKTTTKSTKTY